MELLLATIPDNTMTVLWSIGGVLAFIILGAIGLCIGAFLTVLGFILKLLVRGVFILTIVSMLIGIVFLLLRVCQ